jgi:hypothetical protein
MITEIIDEFYMVIKSRGAMDAVEEIMRLCGLYKAKGNEAIAIEAIARLLVFEHAKARHLEARLLKEKEAA